MTRTRILHNTLTSLPPTARLDEARIEGQGMADLRLKRYARTGGWLTLDWPRYGTDELKADARSITLCRKGIEELHELLGAWLAREPADDE